MVLPYINYNIDEVGAKNIPELEDVGLNNLADGEVLKYNSTTEQRENGEAGGGATEIVETNNLVAKLGTAGASLISGATNNILLGTNAGNGITLGDNNIMLGQDSGANLTIANHTIALGRNTGKSLTNGGDNVILGTDSGQSLTTGRKNVAIGAFALTTATNRQQGVFIGAHSARYGGGNDQVSIGYESGQYHTGKEGVAIGVRSHQFTGGNDGIGDICIGSTAGEKGRAGFINQGSMICIGKNAGAGASLGIDNGGQRCGDLNICIGLEAHRKCVPAINRSIFIGNNCGRETANSSDSGEYNVSIGDSCSYNFTTSSFTTRSYATCVGARAGGGGIDQTVNAGGLFLGYGAGQNIAHGNQIVLNGSGATFDPNSNNGFFVKPIRNDTGVANALFYDATSGEITYNANVIVGASATESFAGSFTNYGILDVICDNLEIETVSNSYDTSTGIFTAPRTAHYLFNYYVRLTDFTGAAGSQISSAASSLLKRPVGGSFSLYCVTSTQDNTFDTKIATPTSNIIIKLEIGESIKHQVEVTNVDNCFWRGDGHAIRCTYHSVHSID